MGIEELKKKAVEEMQWKKKPKSGKVIFVKHQGNKEQIAWAIVQKKDSYEYKKGEIVEIGLFRRVLMMRYNRKYQKIIKIKVIQ